MATHDAQGRELFVCSECKCRRIATEFDVDRHGHRRKGCLRCKAKREARKCPHGRQPYACRSCDATLFCEHGKKRSHCLPCGGGGVCRHGRRMDKACHECPVEGRERNPDAHAKEDHYDRLRKPGTVWERIKGDPEKLAARRLYQVLAKYRKDFPDDQNPPTTTAEATARRFQNGVERRRREREEQAAAQAPLSDADLFEILGFDFSIEVARAVPPPDEVTPAQPPADVAQRKFGYATAADEGSPPLRESSSCDCFFSGCSHSERVYYN